MAVDISLILTVISALFFFYLKSKQSIIFMNTMRWNICLRITHHLQTMQLIRLIYYEYIYSLCWKPMTCADIHSIIKHLNYSYHFTNIYKVHNPNCKLCFSDFDLKQRRHNDNDDVSNHQRPDYLLNLCWSADQRQNQSSESLAFVRGVHRWLVNSPHKGPVLRKMFPFDEVIMTRVIMNSCCNRPVSWISFCVF